MATNYFKWFGQKIITYGNESRGHMLVTVPGVTQHIHDGDCYDTSGTGTLNATTQTDYVFLGVTGEIPIHFHNFNVTSDDGPLLIELIENPTISDNGTIINANNRNRASTKETGMAVYGDATIAGGTVLATREIYGGDVGTHGQGGTGSISEEWVLSPNTAYALRVTNETLLATVNFSAYFFYYELEL